MSERSPSVDFSATLSVGLNIVSVLANLLLLTITYGQLVESRQSARSAAQDALDASNDRKSANQIAESMVTLQRELAQKEADRVQKPLLSIVQCCNQVPIVSPGNTDAIELRRFESINPRVVSGDEDLRARAISPFIARIQNVGEGAALATKLIWEVDKVVLIDGRIVTVEDSYVNGHTRPYVWPAVIPAGGVARILHLPKFVCDDKGHKVVSVSGNILLTCNDSMGNSCEFRQPFTMDTVFKPEKNDDIGPRLSFHFTEPSLTDERYRVAKPALDSFKNPSAKASK